MKNWMIGAMRFCIAILMAAFCLLCKAQGSTTKQLTSFCGFKAGAQKTSDEGTKTWTSAKVPFRNLRNVRLYYSPKGRLNHVSANRFWEKAGVVSVKEKKEFINFLDLCCKDFERFGIVFPKDWDVEIKDEKPLVWLEKRGRNDDASVSVRGMFCGAGVGHNASRQSSKSSSHLLDVNISVWWRHVDDDTITPKTDKYTAESNLSRKEFVERTFDVAFGEEASEGSRQTVNKQLSQPICGMNNIEFFYTYRDRKLSSITMDKISTAKKMEEAEPEYAKLCGKVKDWLGIDSFDIKDSEEKFKTKEGKMLPESSRRISSFEDENIWVKVEMIVWSAESKTAGTNFRIRIGTHKR